MKVGEAHKPFYDHLKNGGKVWRNDPLNEVKEVITIEHPALEGDITNICMFGYSNLQIIDSQQEHLFYNCL